MKEKIRELESYLSCGLVERDTPIQLALLGIFSGEHLFLLGPPGTAKSELARRLKPLFGKAQYFERLLTRFSVPEELFGPLSIKALEEDRYHRLTDRYLPSASIAFVDEIFKANSAILNALLTLLNEREFDNGTVREKTPLITVIGASNELPEEDGLDALFDRFLIRYQVDYVSDDGFDALLDLKQVAACPDQPESPLKISDEEIKTVQRAADDLELDSEALYLLKGLRQHLHEEGISVSDRRWRKVIKLLKVAAYLNGNDRVGVWDCWLLQHCLWQEPDQKNKITLWYQSHLGTDQAMNPERLQRLKQTWQATLEEEKSASVQEKDRDGYPIFIDLNGEQTTAAFTQRVMHRDGEILYLAPPDQADRENGGAGFTRLELLERFFDDHYQQCHIAGGWVNLSDYTRDPLNQLSKRIDHLPLSKPLLYSQGHISSRVEEIEQILLNVERYHQRVYDKLHALSAELVDHLWVEAGFITTAEQNLNRSLVVANQLKEDFQSIKKGFIKLPAVSRDVVSSDMKPAENSVI